MAESGRGTGRQDRAFWVDVAARLARPVLGPLARGELRRVFPFGGDSAGRGDYAMLEAMARLLCGLAPWLETMAEAVASDEQQEAGELANLARRAIAAGTDPASPDYMNFSRGDQPLVDSAFLCHAFLRAPTQLWGKLDDATRGRVLVAMEGARKITPYDNNWLLFSAMIEAFLCKVGAVWRPECIDHALRRHQEWYKGDGAYGDGPTFHWDYYNSYVIHPMLIDVLEAVGDQRPAWAAMKDVVLARARRYAAVQERLISPEGAFPPIGRSLAYRFGAFHLLGQMALRRQLPAELTGAQVRCALTAVIRRMIQAPGTFDESGFLRIGFAGHQPLIAEPYISTGSLYLCSTGLLPLGLPPADPFWATPFADWTSRIAWSGRDLPADHAMDEPH